MLSNIQFSKHEIPRKFISIGVVIEPERMTLNITTVTVNSHKGGVGKTTITVNMAFHLAKQGVNVCLVDNDFSGPAVSTFFEKNLVNKEFKYINDFFDGTAKIKDVLVNFKDDFDLEGNLWVAFADSSPKAMNRMIRVNEQDASKMLVGLRKIKKEVSGSPYGAEFMIIDSAPGINLTTVNSFVTSDIILFVIKMSNADLSGTINMIAGLFDDMGKRIAMVANMVPSDRISSEQKKMKLESLITDRIETIFDGQNIEFLGWVPTDTQLQTIEFDRAVKSLKGIPSRRKIFTLEHPEHLFTKEMDSIIKQM